MQFWTRCTRLFAHGRLGGLRWWQALGVMAASVLMALAISLRYGEPSHFWFVGPSVLLGAVGLLWWSSRSSRSTGEGKSQDDQ